MAICRKRRGGKVYLYEYKSERRDGKVKHVFVKYLGVEGKNGKPIKMPNHFLDKVGFSKTQFYGATSVLWKVCEELGLVDLIDENIAKVNGFSVGKLLVTAAINKIVNPLSFRKLKVWVGRTNLPELMDLEIDSFGKHNFFRALDAVCGVKDGMEYDFTLKIEKNLFDSQTLIPKEVFSSVLYDTTPTFYYGNTCDLAERGYNSKNVDLKQIKVALCVTRNFHIPIFHFVIKGSMMDALTGTKVSQLVTDFRIKKPLVIWDRGVTSLDVIRWAEENNVQLIVGVKNNLREVKHLLDINIEETPYNYITNSEGGAIYGIEKKYKLFKKAIKIIVYKNSKRALKIKTERHSKIANAIETLQELKGSEKDLKNKINKCIKDVKEFFNIQYKKKGFLYKVNEEKIKAAEKTDGRYAIICTDIKLSKKEAIKTYFKKNEVERAFRVLKHNLDMDSISHRIPTRVKAYFFTCFLAYYLYSALEYKLKKMEIKDSVDTVIDKLHHIEKLELKFGKQKKNVLLNLGTYERDILEKLKMNDLILQEPITRPNL